jgi:O-antigen ligase
MTDAPRGLPLRTPWRGWVVAAVFVLTPLLAYLGPLGYPALLALAGVLLMPFWVRRRPPWPTVVMLAALAVWAVGSLGWSPARPRGFAAYADIEGNTALKLVLQLALYSAFAAAAARLSSAAARRALLLLSWGLIALALVIVLEAFSGAAAYQFLKRTFEDPIRPDLALRNVGQGTIALALLAWAVIPGLQARARWAPYVLAGVTVLAAGIFGQLSPAAALPAGGLVALLVLRAGPWGARVAGVLAAAAVMLMPSAVLLAEQSGWIEAVKESLPRSWEARLVIWPHAAGLVADRPWLGWGLDASRHFGLAIPLHPHNGPLQVWLELGAVGAALFALFWFWVFNAIAGAARHDRVGAAACAGAATAYFTIGALSFGVWQEWWLALGVLTGAACLVMLTTRAREQMAQPPQTLRPDELTPL